MSKSRLKSDGYWHGRLTIAATPIAAAVGILIGWGLGYSPLQCGILAAIGCLAGLYIDPDLDQEMITASEWRVLKIPLIGIIIGTAWVALWLPYAILMPHRGISHTPVVGTLTRVLWVSAPIWFYFHLARTSITYYVDPTQLIVLFTGLALSDIVHFGRDKWGWKL